jgi:uncharacterized membrane protein
MARRHLHGIESTAQIAGHPIHPMLVPLPIGLLVGALASDLAYYWTEDPFWARGSLWLLMAGIVTGLVAGLAGLVDFVTIREANSTAAGWVHVLGNLTALAIAAGNVWFRWNNPAEIVKGFGVWLSAAVVALLCVTGWLGGELSYRYRIGVIDDTSH